MSVSDATNSGDASNSEENAQNIGTSKKSEKKLKLLCNPRELPPSPIPRANVPDEKTMSINTKMRIRDYFWDKYFKSEKRARERKWI